MSELTNTLNHIQTLLEENNGKAKFNLDQYDGNCKELLQELNKRYDVEQNGTELKISSNQFGTVTFNGKEFNLTQDAYVVNYGTEGEVRYEASAVDTDGNNYLVIWETTEEYNKSQRLHNLEDAFEAGKLDEEEIEEIEELQEEYDSGYCEDESNACDWENPIEVKEA